MVSCIAWQARHGIWYGLACMALNSVWPDGHGMVYVMAWYMLRPGGHGMWYAWRE